MSDAANRRHGAWLVLSAAALAAVAVAVIGDPDGGERGAGVTVADVAADPARYDGRQVVLRGTVAAIPQRVPRGSDGALVLAGRKAGGWSSSRSASSRRTASSGA